MLPTLGAKTPDFGKRRKNVPGVTNDSMKTVPWMSIWLATVEKNHIRTNLNNNALLSNMWFMICTFVSDFGMHQKNVPGVTNDSIQTVAWMSIWPATVERNHVRTTLKNYRFLSNMRFCMWFIRFLSVSIIVSHSSHERFKLSLEGTCVFLQYAVCWLPLCFPYWDQIPFRHWIQETSVKLHHMWLMVQFRLSHEEAFAWPLWREATSEPCEQSYAPSDWLPQMTYSRTANILDVSRHCVAACAS